VPRAQVTAARLVMRQAVVREDAGGRKLSLCAEGLATVRPMLRAAEARGAAGQPWRPAASG
jgi:hypothetical protein